MSREVVPLLVHESQFPDQVEKALVSSLRKREVDHRFHYSTHKQAQAWLEIFKTYSPFEKDPSCRQIYEQSYSLLSRQLSGKRVHLVGLGCGSGDKDLKLLNTLKTDGAESLYTAVDVSTSLVLTAHQRIRGAGYEQSTAIVCDLADANDLATLLNRLTGEECAPSRIHASMDATRLLTFFGLLPNFEPYPILAVLEALLRPGDLLLMSANMTASQTATMSMQQILTQYNNAPTNQWLLMFLFDLGIQPDAGTLEWEIQADTHDQGIGRFVAFFIFKRPQRITVLSEDFHFNTGERIRLFFSYRYTPQALRRILAKRGIVTENELYTSSTEEAVLTCRKRDLGGASAAL